MNEEEDHEEAMTMEGGEDDGAAMALLWTDGRYFLQADTELGGSSWRLMKSGMPKVLEPVDWLANHLKPGSRVGMDPMVVTVSMARQYSETLAAMQCSLIPVEQNLVDTVWEQDRRPSFPNGKVRVNPLQFAGVDVRTKITQVREELRQEDANALLVNTLDEVAWLLNIRGCDVENSPVVVAYVLLTDEEATLYIDETKVSNDVQEHLSEAGVAVKGYACLKRDLQVLCEKEESKIWIDPDQLTSGLFDLMCNTIHAQENQTISNNGAGAGRKGNTSVRVLKDVENGHEYLYDVDKGVVLPNHPNSNSKEEESEKEKGVHSSIRLQDESGKLVEHKSPIALAKATKNEDEIRGLVTAHHRDGVALAHFLEWLEIQVLKEGLNPTEYEIAAKLREMRADQAGFIEPSFPTIAGEGANGAIIHYRPEAETANSLSPNSMLLLDSGGQYDCGTTDVTRTVHFGNPSQYQKECFTRVLKGHIALSTLVFPEGTPGFMVDSFARSSLWRGGLDYRHGTGHGVGAGLNVHEGPQGISARYSNTTGLKDGMVLSNEPGYYEDGSFGIRIENLVWVSDAKTDKEFGEKKYLKFNDLTVVPIQRKLILEEMLSEEETKWVNEYHAMVWERLNNDLSGSTKEWLKRQTAPI
jgi:Xaa-Pro aminopeptidase